MEEIAFDHKHHITDFDPENLTAVCSICGPVTVYVSCRRYTSYPKKPVTPPESVYDRNIKLINDYIQKHQCKRCGVWGLGAPENFRFFELHLPLRERIARLAHKANPESLKAELANRDLFCKTCYPHIKRFYTKNISIPPVNKS
jgi:hypothetical protein